MILPTERERRKRKRERNSACANTCKYACVSIWALGVGHENILPSQLRSVTGAEKSLSQIMVIFCHRSDFFLTGSWWLPRAWVRKSRYWRETLQFPHPLLWRNEASLLVHWRTMHFPLALWTLIVYILCCRRTGQCFSVLRTRNSDVILP